MKIWFDKGSSNSADYYIIYVFRNVEDVEKFVRALDNFIKVIEHSQGKGDRIDEVIMKFFENYFHTPRESFAKDLAKIVCENLAFLYGSFDRCVEKQAKEYLNGVSVIVDWDSVPSFGAYGNTVVIHVYTSGYIEVFDLILKKLGISNFSKIILSDELSLHDIAYEINKLLEEFKSEKL